jgi:DnaJ-class molecular chaperone
MTTLYDTLDIPVHATSEEIKIAYRRAAMRWHPDRNVGQENAARAAFLDIQSAYAILSSPAQRQVYDSVFTVEMERREAQRQREEHENVQREAAARAAEAVAYTNMVALAMRFANQDFNRDVILGVLLGSDCGIELAQRIADSALALHASRQSDAASVQSANCAPETTTEQVQDDPITTDRARSFPGVWFPFWNVLRS